MFRVLINKHLIKIYNIKTDNLITEIINFDGLWIGYDHLLHKHGNTILVKLTNRTYMFIGGHQIYTFKTNERIWHYFSQMTDEGPKPFAFGTSDYIYLPLIKGKISMEQFQKTENIFFEDIPVNKFYNIYYHVPKKLLTNILIKQIIYN